MLTAEEEEPPSAVHLGGLGAKAAAASPGFGMAGSASRKSPERELLIEERRESPSRSLLLSSASKRPFGDAGSAGGNDGEDDENDDDNLVVDVEEEEEEEEEEQTGEKQQQLLRQRQLDQGGSKRSLGNIRIHLLNHSQIIRSRFSTFLEHYTTSCFLYISSTITMSCFLDICPLGWVTDPSPPSYHITTVSMPVELQPSSSHVF